MSYLIKRVYEGFMYKKDGLHFYPLTSMVVLVCQLMLVILNNEIVLMGLLFFVLLENILFKNASGALNLFFAIIPLLLFLGLVSYFFGGLEQVFFVLLKILIGAFGFSLFFSITNPSDMTRSLEKIGLPSKIAIVPSLALMMAPRIGKDAEETFDTLMLRGEIKGTIFTWLPKVLAIFVASILYRSEFLAHSLFYRGYGLMKRTHYKEVRVHLKDSTRLVIWLLLCISIIIARKSIPTIIFN